VAALTKPRAYLGAAFFVAGLSGIAIAVLLSLRRPRAR
jgi:hypothetical protein